MFLAEISGRYGPDLHIDIILGFFEQLYQVSTFGVKENSGNEITISAYRMRNLAAMAKL